MNSLLHSALREPIAAPPLHEAARGCRNVVLLADDLTRQTPVRALIPLLLDELNAGGVDDAQVTVLIALGTHRPMTPAEIDARFGPEVRQRVRVLNNPWQDPAQMVDLGETANGTPIQVSRIAAGADFLLGLGNIVPHHIPGFSAGAKIVQPGICGPATTAATHLLSAHGPHSYLGVVENPVRAEMEEIADRVGLRAILNTVLDPQGGLAGAFYGDVRRAYRAGVGLARQVYGVPLPGLADIVIAGSHPCDIEFWQAHKSLYPAALSVRPGGEIVVVTPCPEGVSVTHGEMLEYAALSFAEIEALIARGEVHDLVAGSLALAMARVRERATVRLVSGGIPPEHARALGFTPHATVEEALAEARRRQGAEAEITVLTHAPDMLPLLASQP